MTTDMDAALTLDTICRSGRSGDRGMMCTKAV